VLIDAIINSSKAREFGFINELYEGQIESSVQCFECNLTSQKFDNFQDISLPVRNNISFNCLENAISNFLKPEKLALDNMYDCIRCNKKVFNILYIIQNKGRSNKVHKVYETPKHTFIPSQSIRIRS